MVLEVLVKGERKCSSKNVEGNMDKCREKVTAMLAAVNRQLPTSHTPTCRTYHRTTVQLITFDQKSLIVFLKNENKFQNSEQYEISEWSRHNFRIAQNFNLWFQF